MTKRSLIARATTSAAALIVILLLLLLSACSADDPNTDAWYQKGEFYVWDGSGWVQITANGTGDVIGPAGATDNAIVRWDGVTGKLVQDSSAIIDNFGVLEVAGDITNLADGSDIHAGNDLDCVNDLGVGDDADIGGNLAVVGSLSVGTVAAYANNAAALAGGLVAGDLYRTGGDPDLLCIVH